MAHSSRHLKASTLLPRGGAVACNRLPGLVSRSGGVTGRVRSAAQPVPEFVRARLPVRDHPDCALGLVSPLAH
jgi:hypothetical protein